MFIRFHNLSQLTRMDRTTQCGHGGSGNCFVVGVRDPEHNKTLGTHDVVFYVAKMMLSVDRWGISGREEAVKEMLAFPISHPAVCAPVGGIIDEESPTLLFPWWNGGQISHWIERELELRWKRTTNGLRRKPTKDQAKEGMRLYHVGNLDPHAWVAPELTREKACPDLRGRKYITCFTEATDIYAMGYVLRNLCGDFFSDMTPSQRSTYDDEMFAKGFPTGASLPHAVHGLRLREALDRMTTVNIANRIDHRRTAAYWATFFQEQLMVDPLVCQRPQEMKPRQKKHPDGPREIRKNKL
ncbi:hypothetical protein R1sor_016807 [Riccia sorocarpa]|uniref:Protein kinase domain-containing protein n=1 Tax=Riccia sorocarpa TaxID=122646 RepID=A0ABD3HFY4_9MARC